MVNLIEKKIPLAQVKELKGGEESYKMMEEMMPYLHRYNQFMKAKNLGIKFGPQDITIEDLNYFHAISECFSPIPKGLKNGIGKN